MTGGAKLVVWSEVLEKHQQLFASRGMEKTVGFLQKARTPGEGWGSYPLLGTDLHHSCLVIEALSKSCDPAAIGTVAGAASYIRVVKGPTLKQLSLDEISDLLTIATAEQKPGDDDYVQQLIEAWVSAFKRATDADGSLSIRTQCVGLLALVESGKANQTWIEEAIGGILTHQLPDGSWPAVVGETTSLIATSMAIRVLKRTKNERSKEALTRAAHFLQRYVIGATWSKIGNSGDTFTQAVVLRALADVPFVEYNVIRSGIDSLLSRINKDGSWGGAPTEAGSIEMTALCLLALTAAGENRFVPAQMARAALNEVQIELNSVTEERDKLRADFDKKVQAECGLVVTQRNELLKENQELKTKVQNDQVEIARTREAQEAAELKRLVLEQEAELLRRRSNIDLQTGSSLALWLRLIPWSVIFRVVVVFLVAASFSMTVAKWWQAPVSKWWQSSSQVAQFTLIGALVLLIASAALVVWRSRARTTSYSEQYSRYDLRREGTPSRLNSLRSMYLSMAESWPNSVREELTYRLFTELIDVPQDIGQRSAEELTYRLAFPAEERARFADWIRHVMRLDPIDRRILFEQLRQLTIR